jgi:outer membrane protein assembly factor BamB
VVGSVAVGMTRATDPGAEQPTARHGELGWVVGVGALVGGLSAGLVALFLPMTAREGFSGWVRVTAVVMVPVGWQAVFWSRQSESEWSGVARHKWAVALGLVAALLGWWAVCAAVADIQTGLPGPAAPLLAVGCAAVLVAAVLLAVTPPARPRHGSVVRQALPAAAALVTVIAVATVAELAALRWIPVDATTAERVDPAAVPDEPTRVRWSWPTSDRLRGAVAAGPGVIVAAGDRVVALDGPTGAQRWHHRWVGAEVRGLTATPDGRTVVAEVRPGGQSSTAVFAFDAHTGEVRWSRHPGFEYLDATDHALVSYDGTEQVGIDPGSGEELWRWREPTGCTVEQSRPTPDAMLNTVSCVDYTDHGSDPATSTAVIAVDDRTGRQRWRFAGTAASDQGLYQTFLDVSPNGLVAAFAPTTEEEPTTGVEKQQEPVLLESATGAVLYRPDGDAEIVVPDPHTPLLRRAVPGGEPRLVLHDLSTGAEHPLQSMCSDALAITPGSVLSACFGEWRERAAHRATVEVHSRSGATPAAFITVTDAVRTIVPSTSPPFTALIPVRGAVVLAVRSFPLRDRSVVIGLT